jgi:hypothetical protein
MTRRFSRTRPLKDQATALPPLARPLTAEQIQRWAELIANGDDQFPRNLLSCDRDQLAAEVRHRRRERLMVHIARAIALDLRDAALPKVR